MRDTVFTLSQGGSQEDIERLDMDGQPPCSAYVPGYRLKQKVQFEHIGDNSRCASPASAPSPASRRPFSSRSRARRIICRPMPAISTS
jgi:acetaldehyde dehydrogenase (acetylating)